MRSQIADPPNRRVRFLIPDNGRDPETTFAREQVFIYDPDVGPPPLQDEPEEPDEPRPVTPTGDTEFAAQEAEKAFREIKDRPGRSGNFPPKEHRFKPGQSGNPGGRRHGQGYITSYLRDVFRMDGERRLAAAIAAAWIGQACRGNHTALRELLNRIDGIPPESKFPVTETEIDSYAPNP